MRMRLLKEKVGSFGKLLSMGFEKLILLLAVVVVFAFGFFSEGGLISEAQRLSSIERVSEAVFTVIVLFLGVVVLLAISKMIVNYEKKKE